MKILAAVCGLILIAVVLWEGFETIVLPRRVTRRFRLTRLFYRSTWRPWTRMVRAVVPARLQETWLSVFGPASLLLLLTLWAAGLIAGFALLIWASGSAVEARDQSSGFLTDLYLSGTTFFTLGLGDVIPRSTAASLLLVVESGMGFAFLALVFSYLPALNQTFARREARISLLDARAGSPPTAYEILRRHGHDGGLEALRQLLHEWEQWAAEFLEGHLSYPVLAYFRSQHDNESWLSALTAILDACALIMAFPGKGCARQAELTFAMARHAAVDLCLIFRVAPREPAPDRLPMETLVCLGAVLPTSGMQRSEGETAGRKLGELRKMYEPYVQALSVHFQMDLPPWYAPGRRADNWQGSIGETPGPGGARPGDQAREEHFRYNRGAGR